MTDQGASPELQFAILKDVMVPMRDGVRLATDIALPSEDGVTPAESRFPTLILRTPYNKNFVSQMPPDIVANAAGISPAVGASKGYVVIYQDARGAYGSEGKLKPMLNEAHDGADTLAWIRDQPWSDGRIAFFGPSYHGGVQMMAATEAPEGLVTAFCQTAATDQYKNAWVYFDGVFALRVATQWTILQSADPAAHESEASAARVREDLDQFTTSTDFGWAFDTHFPPEVFDRLARTLPIRNMPIARHLPFWREWVENRDNPAYFAPTQMDDKFGKIDIPMIHVGGWYDLFLRNTYEYYEGLSTGAASREAREGQRLFIGPWSHGACVDCPPGGAISGVELQLAWMDEHFKSVKHPLFDHAVTLYVMGENRWRAEAAWPLPGTERTRYYLHSQGGANSASGNGMLSTERPGQERPDQYHYDPADPAPTIGGIDLAGSRAAQNEAEARSDVLCYTSAELSEDVEVTGKVTASLFAASSATDTDWWMRLVDVQPNGRADSLSHGVVRARYRNSRTNPEPLTPGEIVEYVIDMQATSNVFKKGHRIRVEVSSSCFPLGDRNPNAFVDLNSATEADFVVATQTVYHDAEHPSSVELPIIPLSRERQWIDTPFPLPGGKHFEFVS